MSYGGWQIHVIPVEDTHTHEAGQWCWCAPTTNEDGTIVHNAADNREAFERGERKPT